MNYEILFIWSWPWPWSNDIDTWTWPKYCKDACVYWKLSALVVQVIAWTDRQRHRLNWNYYPPTHSDGNKRNYSLILVQIILGYPRGKFENRHKFNLLRKVYFKHCENDQYLGMAMRVMIVT